MKLIEVLDREKVRGGLYIRYYDYLHKELDEIIEEYTDYYTPDSIFWRELIELIAPYWK